MQFDSVKIFNMLGLVTEFQGLARNKAKSLVHSYAAATKSWIYSKI